MGLAWGSRTYVMGVINLTPDSFSDGGRCLAPERALAQARRLVAQGVHLLDLGAQSTRPGAADVGAAEEQRRLLPALELILEARAAGGLAHPEGVQPLISIDTFRAPVAAAALEAGADWINDVGGGRLDPAILNVVAAAGCPYVLMHSRGDSRSMDSLARYGAVAEEVLEELRRSTDRALAAGLERGQLIWDPGLGFAKTTRHNLELLEALPRLRAEGFPLLVGPSRKRFIGEVLAEPRPRARLWGLAAVAAKAIAGGADILRVHDGGPMVQTARMADALWRSERPADVTATTSVQEGLNSI